MYISFFVSKNEIFTCVLLLLSFIVLMEVCLLDAVWKILSPLFKWGENKFMLCTLINSLNSQSDSKVRSAEVIQTQHIHWHTKTTKSCTEVKTNKWLFNLQECQRKDRKMRQHILELLLCVRHWDTLFVKILIPIFQMKKLSPGKVRYFFFTKKLISLKYTI